MASIWKNQALVFRRLLAAVALVGFLAGTVGLPVLRQPSAGKDRSNPFPCQDHACGCASAEQCWQSCCCYSNTQKLAWAKQHHVDPPPYVVAAAQHEHALATSTSCCSLKSNSCCTSQSTCGGDGEGKAHDEHAAEVSWSIDWVSAIQARRCQGHAELWLTMAAVPLPPSHTELEFNQAVCGRVQFATPTLQSVSFSPATPPPRA